MFSNHIFFEYFKVIVLIYQNFFKHRRKINNKLKRKIIFNILNNKNKN